MTSSSEGTPKAQGKPLSGKRIAVPEARQLDLFAEMLEIRGASVVRCPLVAIRDAPDAAPIEAWLRAFADGACHDLVLLTGEGLYRLLGFAERAGDDLYTRFVAALGATRTIGRGPKPGRALRTLGLNLDVRAETPTTDGVIATLGTLDLADHVVGVQLYGSEPNTKLTGFVDEAGAYPRPVAPYIYADATEDTRVRELVGELAAGGVDAIAFTSSPQVKRLFSVACGHQDEAALRAGLEGCVVAAVGPLVAETLQQHGISADLMPESNYFMKPLVRELVRCLTVA